MASYHLTAKIGNKGKAAPHAAYIAREGKYSGSERYEDMETTGYGNMPTWAEQDPAQFWQAADQHERANGSSYREIEIALPRELTATQRLELVQDFIAQELDDKHAYQFAIHTPKAAIEEDEQPHAHIMYSERMQDSIKRDQEQYFKRYNAKNPENGGAKKFRRGNGMTELKADLLATRERWADIQNKHLEKHGHSERVTHLSLEDQGIERTPEKHIGINAYKMSASDKDALMERRTDAKEYAAAVGELSGVNLTVAIRTAKADKTSTEYEAFKRQRQAEKEKVDKTATAYEAFKQQRQAEREREEKERQKLKPQTTTKKKDIDLERRPHGKRRLLQDFCRYGGSTNRFERSFLVGFGSGKVTVRWFLAVLERFLEVVRSKKPYKTTLYGCTVVYGGLYGLKTLIKQRCTVVRWIFPFFLFCIFYSQF